MATLAICVVGSRTILLNVQPHGQFATGLVLVLVVAEVLPGGAAGFVCAIRCH